MTAMAGAAAAPAIVGGVSAADLDVAIVGAGAAGIAAARKLVAAGKRVRIFEAMNRVGGRCVTDTSRFGVPCDLGAHWIHMPDVNPVAKLAARTGLEVYPAPPGQKLRIGRRFAREGEMEQFLASLVRSRRAIEEASRKIDMPCAQALPPDLGDWRATVEFYLGPFGCGKDLQEISAQDFAKSWERDIDAFCRQGFGTLIAKLAEGLPVDLGAPVTTIDSRPRNDVAIETGKGRLVAAAVIVTASTNVLAGGKIAFAPDLPADRARRPCWRMPAAVRLPMSMSAARSDVRWRRRVRARWQPLRRTGFPICSAPMSSRQYSAAMPRSGMPNPGCRARSPRRRSAGSRPAAS